MADKQLFTLTSILILIGIIFSYSLSVYTIVQLEASEFNFVLKQSITGMVSIGLMWWISTQDPDVIVPLMGVTLLVFALIAMIAMPFLPESMVTIAGGARRWIRLPGFSIAPVEFFKIGFIFFLAWSFDRKFTPHENNLHATKEILILIPYFFLFMIVVFLVFIIQNDLGQTVLMGILLLILSLLAGMRFRSFFGLIALALLMLVVVIYSTNKLVRVKLWWASAQSVLLPLLPDVIANTLRVDNLPEPYQIGNSLNAIYNGGIFGTGLGNGNLKYGYLSEVHTDFVLAGITEEMGLIFLLFIVLLIFILSYKIFKIANRSENIVYFLFSAGIATQISLAFLINALGIAGITPIKGMAVPFLSYGGSSTLALAIGVGMVLSISKKVKINV